jgi:hypothetical protein
MEELEQPLSAAFAVGAMSIASAMSVAMVKVLVMVLRFMTVLLLVGRSGGQSGSPARYKESRAEGYGVRSKKDIE